MINVFTGILRGLPFIQTLFAWFVAHKAASTAPVGTPPVNNSSYFVQLLTEIVVVVGLIALLMGKIDGEMFKQILGGAK